MTHISAQANGMSGHQLRVSDKLPSNFSSGTERTVNSKFQQEVD